MLEQSFNLPALELSLIKKSWSRNQAPWSLLQPAYNRAQQKGSRPPSTSPSRPGQILKFYQIEHVLKFYRTLSQHSW